MSHCNKTCPRGVSATTAALRADAITQAISAVGRFALGFSAAIQASNAPAEQAVLVAELVARALSTPFRIDAPPLGVATDYVSLLQIARIPGIVFDAALHGNYTVDAYERSARTGLRRVTLRTIEYIVLVPPPAGLLVMALNQWRVVEVSAGDFRVESLTARALPNGAIQIPPAQAAPAAPAYASAYLRVINAENPVPPGGAVQFNEAGPFSVLTPLSQPGTGPAIEGFMVGAQGAGIYAITYTVTAQPTTFALGGGVNTLRFEVQRNGEPLRNTQAATQQAYRTGDGALLAQVQLTGTAQVRLEQGDVLSLNNTSLDANGAPVQVNFGLNLTPPESAIAAQITLVRVDAPAPFTAP